MHSDVFQRSYNFCKIWFIARTVILFVLSVTVVIIFYTSLSYGYGSGILISGILLLYAQNFFYRVLTLLVVKIFMTELIQAQDTNTLPVVESGPLNYE